MNAFTLWLSPHWPLWAVVLLIALVAFNFWAKFVTPALRLRHTLGQAIERLNALKIAASSHGIDLEKIEQEVMHEPRLAHLWGQYANGLHPHWRESPNMGSVSAPHSRVQALSDTLFSALKARSGKATVDLNNIEQQVMGDPRLSSLWADYSAALQGTADAAPAAAAGPAHIRQWRASAPAEHYFSEHALVDSPLQTDFYKHVPGILTGLGIIGTFSGLIMGLIHFDVSDPETTQQQLSLLVQTVGQAFWVSAAAIALAMLFTWLEKSLLTARYAQVEALQHQLDSLFEASSAEVYLERLLAAAEAQATASQDMLRELRKTLSALNAK